MNWPNLPVTKGQHAPAHPAGSCPPCSVVRHAVRSAPVQTASKKSQFRTCGIAQASSSRLNTDMAESTGVANRFLRIQAAGPTCERGAASARAISVRTQDMSCSCMAHLSFKAILALNQFMKSDRNSGLTLMPPVRLKVPFCG